MEENPAQMTSSSLMSNALLLFLLLSVPLIIVAITLNGLAFLVFYKKPVFRKILANRLVINLMTINVASCLLLFPAIIYDMQMSSGYSNSKTISFLNPMNNSKNNDGDDSISNNLNIIDDSYSNIHSGKYDPGYQNYDSSSINISASKNTGMCIISSVLSTTITHTSLFAMLTVGLDQYMAVILPLEYTTRMTSSFYWQLISTVWVLGALAAIPGSLQMMSAGEMSPWFSCRHIVMSISESQNKQQYASSTTPSILLEASSSNVDYLVSPSLSLSIDKNIDSFIFSMPYSLRCGLSSLSMISYIIPILTLGYMYIRIFWEASKSGRDNRRRSSLFLPNNNLNEIVNGLSSDVLNEDSIREKCNGIENKDKIIENGFSNKQTSQDTNDKDIFSIGSSGPNTTISELKDVTLYENENKPNSDTVAMQFSKKNPPRLNNLRRNTIQGSVFSHTIEMSPNLNRSTSQSSVETNNPFFPSRDSGYVDGIQLQDGSCKETNDNVTKWCEYEPAQEHSSKVIQNGKDKIIYAENNGNIGALPIKEELKAVSNEKLSSKNHIENIGSTNNDNHNESTTNDESENHLRRKRKVNETHQGSPIIKSRHDSMNNGINGSNDNISRKKYLTAKQRKCSFSSFNECRYLEDNGRTTTTYFFSSDAETMRPNKNENHLFDKLASSDQLHFALKEDEIRMNGNAMGRAYRNGSPIKRAIKRNSKNIGYSNSFNVSADIRRKLFVNRYKEWSLQASKKPGSNIDISSIPIQKRFSDISDESHTSFPTSNTPLIKETNGFSFELSNEGTQNTETSNTVHNNEDDKNACTNGYALSLESDTSSPKHLKPESLHKPLLRPLSAEENVSKMKPSNSFLSINHAFSNPSLTPNGTPLNHHQGSLLSMTSHVARRLSFNVSRKASSVFQFFQDKEEFRTAKLTFLVVVVAFICWSPFMGVLLWPLLQTNPNHTVLTPSNSSINFSSVNSTLSPVHTFKSIKGVPPFIIHPDLTTESNVPSIFWLHFISCIMILAFTAISPYVYVFRSKKVRKCLKDISKDQLFCNFCRPKLSEQLNSASVASKLSVNNLPSNEKDKTSVKAINGQPTKFISVFKNFKTKNSTQNQSNFSINKINNNLEVKSIKASASQIDFLPNNPPLNIEKYHIRYVDKTVGGKLSKTISCPDVLKLPTKVCLESSL